MAKKPNRSIIIWLLTGCVLIACMVAIGGITRLTHSGLSMVEWDPIMGAIPPMNEQEWNEAFEQYKQFPEYQMVNYNMELSEFKSIFFWEYLHRLWGRMMGLVFFIPFVIFWMRGRLKDGLLKKCFIILIGGGAVGGIGWFMVLSGLKDRPDVSHYRLAIHLMAAFTLCAYIFWVALGLIYPQKTTHNGTIPLRKWVRFALAILVLQIIYGAFVAGLDAGKIYNTFPTMNGAFIPENTFSLDPFWTNLVEHKDGVQFLHRNIAYLVVLLIGVIWFKARKLTLLPTQRKGITALLVVVLLQFVLGVLTLLYSVPVALGVMHQLGALVLLLTLLYANHRLKYASH